MLVLVLHALFGKRDCAGIPVDLNPPQATDFLAPAGGDDQQPDDLAEMIIAGGAPDRG